MDDGSHEEPGRQRAWWEWVLIVVGVLIVAAGGLCIAALISLNQMH